MKKAINHLKLESAIFSVPGPLKTQKSLASICRKTNWKIALSVVVLVCIQVVCQGQIAQTFFYDNYNRTAANMNTNVGGTPNVTYAVTTTGTATIAANGSVVTFNPTVGSASSKAFLTAAYPTSTTYFSTTSLASNTGKTITWTFNIRSSVAITALPANGSVSAGVALTGNNANSWGGGKGYGVVYNSSGNLQFGYFTSGLQTWVSDLTSTIGGTNYLSVTNPTGNVFFSLKHP